MNESQQDTKKKSSYEQWTTKESDLLLELMVDAAARGWRDNSGIFTKGTVEERILPVLNERLGCNKTYNNYQSRLKWYKNRWLAYSALMKNGSGFGYDHSTKKFTASDEVWDTYLAAHPKDGYIRYGVFTDYEDLEIALGNGVAIGKSSIGLGNATDARTLVDDEPRDLSIEDLSYDVENEMFVGRSQTDSPFGSTPPSGSAEVTKASTQRSQPKRSRVQYEANSNSGENVLQNDVMQEIKKITSTFEEVHSLLQKRDDILEKRERERGYTTWDAIKEIPNLDEDIRLKAFDLLDTKSKKDGFLKMTIEERANWITYKLRG